MFPDCGPASVFCKKSDLKTELSKQKKTMNSIAAKLTEKLSLDFFLTKPESQKIHYRKAQFGRAFAKKEVLPEFLADLRNSATSSTGENVVSKRTGKRKFVPEAVSVENVPDDHRKLNNSALKQRRKTAR
jgi:hypothetical protein